MKASFAGGSELVYAAGATHEHKKREIITMPSAARIGDVTNHGGTIAGPGVPTVLIGGMPASVATDLHICPIVPPHPPSTPFPVGSTTVFIGGKPALRVGDVSGCGASPVVGDPTVQIG